MDFLKFPFARGLARRAGAFLQLRIAFMTIRESMFRMECTNNVRRRNSGGYIRPSSPDGP